MVDIFGEVSHQQVAGCRWDLVSWLTNVEWCLNLVSCLTNWDVVANVVSWLTKLKSCESEAGE